METIDQEKSKKISQNEEEDFETEKTKSVSKFPTNKIISNNDFTLEEMPKNFSKSLKFNFPGHFAPKLKIRYSNKIPAPLNFRKYTSQENTYNEDVENENALSEKDASFDSIVEPNSPQPELNEVVSTESKSTIENKQKKAYEHYSIGIFPTMRESYEFADHKSIREWRSILFNIKNNNVKKYYKEVEYKINEKSKKKYRLDIVRNNTKKEDKCKIIEIHAMEHKEVEDDENLNMDNFRNTISFNASSYNKQLNQLKGFTIMDILMHKRSSKIETNLMKK